MKIRTAVLFFFLFLPGALIALPALHAQTPTRTIWDGVYTQEQAKRGQLLYSQNCTECHGEQLTGAEMTPALSGEDFMIRWYGMTVADIFDRIRTAMPQNSPGKLSSQESIDVVAFILSYNKTPAGANELPGQAAPLKAIQFDLQKPGR